MLFCFISLWHSKYGDRVEGRISGFSKSFAPLGIVLSSFDGELGLKVCNFFEQLEEVANLYEWNVTEHLRVARCKLTGIA